MRVPSGKSRGCGLVAAYEAGAFDLQAEVCLSQSIQIRPPPQCDVEVSTQHLHGAAVQATYGRCFRPWFRDMGSIHAQAPQRGAKPERYLFGGQQASPFGQRGGLDPDRDTEFAENVGHVHAGGLAGDEQRGRRIPTWLCPL